MASNFKIGDILESATIAINNNFEPQRKNRFIIEFTEQAGISIPAYMCKSADKPKMSLNAVTWDYINTKRKFAGKGEWQDCTIVLTNPIAPSASEEMYAWLLQCNDLALNTGGYSAQYKKDITVITLGPVNEVVEKWTYKGAFPTNIDFGNHDHSDDGLNEITVSLAMDYAIFE